MKPATLNRLLGHRIVSIAAACPRTRFFVSPGARSAPLAAALDALPPERVIVHHDERGMAFSALGHAKVTGEPAVCVTTSGTAAANLHPAVVEAYHSATPLVLLTADRPPELRGSGANQTIHQPGLFAAAVVWEGELPCPPAGEGGAETLAVAEQLMCEAWRHSLAPRPGPVHLNCPFREPVLEPGSVTDSHWKARAPEENSEPEESTEVRRAAEGIAAGCGGAKGCVVVGALTPREQAGAGMVLRLAELLAWPVLADPFSGLSLSSHPNIARHASALASAGKLPQPQTVLRLGGPLVSKHLIRLESGAADRLCVHAGGLRFDPHLTHARVLNMDPLTFCRLTAEVFRGNPSPSSWLDTWRAATERTEKIFAEMFDEGAPNEPGAARAVASLPPDGALLFVGNSTPPRDFDWFAGVPRPGPRPVLIGNRGASGIDGNLATIAGCAFGHAGPVAALIGDLAVLHDLSSLPLLVKAAADRPIALCVINNQGGGIFQLLPWLEGCAFVERLVETPHAMDFGRIAQAFGCRHVAPDSMKALRDALGAALGCVGVTLIEVRTDRAENAALHREAASRVRSGA